MLKFMVIKARVEVETLSLTKIIFVAVVFATACVESSHTEKAGVLAGKLVSVAVDGNVIVSLVSPIVIDDPDCLMISFTLICDTIILF